MMNKMKSNCFSVIVIVTVIASILLTLQQAATVSGANLHKRSFASLGCLGVYDKSKFARLDRVCEECYQMFREPDIHAMCRQDCFSNDIFTKCVSTLLLTNEHPKLQSYISDLAVGKIK